MDNIRTAEDILANKGTDLIGVPPETTVQEALAIMAEKRIGAMLVMEGGKIVGIWTERDLMNATAKGSFDPTTATIGSQMTAQLHAAPHSANTYALADMILGLRVRHLLIEREGTFIGVLSSGDVLRAGLQKTTEQLKELEALVHLQYYDEWKWGQKK